MRCRDIQLRLIHLRVGSGHWRLSVFELLLGGVEIGAGDALVGLEVLGAIVVLGSLLQISLGLAPIGLGLVQLVSVLLV